MSGQVVQAKLRIGPQDGPLEREADRAAATAVAGWAAPVRGAAGLAAQRECAACDEDEREEEIRMTAALGGPGHGAGTETAEAAALAAGGAPLPADVRAYFEPRPRIPSVVHEVLRSPGQPLDPATRAFMEPRFGHNFGNVRVHNDTKSANSARAVNAQAYAVGQQIVFGANQFAPMSHQGRELLAHELAHTVQQRSLAADPPLVHSNGILESSASAAARTVGKGQAISSPLPASGTRLSRQPAGATEDAERARLAAEAEAALARYAQLEKKWEKEKTEEGQEEAARQRKLFPPISSALQGMPLLSDEEIPDEKKRRENEEKEEKARKEQELEESHDRLLVLRGMLGRSSSGAIRYGYSIPQIMAMITNESLLDGQLLRRYGLELPPSRFTRRITFYHQVIDAIDKFDYAWNKAHGTAATTANPLTAEDVKAMQAEQKRKEDEAAQVEGLEHVEGSLAGAVGAAATEMFTDDPKKITAGAKIGTAVSGTAGSIAAAKAVRIEERARESTEKDVPPTAAEIAPKPQSEPTPTPDQPPPSSAAAPPVADVPVPYAPRGPLEKTQPAMAFETTEPGGAPQPGPPTQSSIPPASPEKLAQTQPPAAVAPPRPADPLGATQPGVAFETTQPGAPAAPQAGETQPSLPPPGIARGRRARETLPGHPPPMPRRPPPPRPVIPWFPRQDGTSVSPEDVMRILSIDPRRVEWSFDAEWNMAHWNHVGGHGRPPLAFTAYGNVRVDYWRWHRLGYPDPRH